MSEKSQSINHVLRGEIVPVAAAAIKENAGVDKISSEALYFNTGEDEKALAVQKIFTSVIAYDEGLHDASAAHANLNLDRGATPMVFLVSDHMPQETLDLAHTHVIEESNRILAALESPIQI